MQMTKYYSQDNQDKFLEENIFKGFENGIFVDVGAWDGIEINNTYFFEKKRNWTGINIEPNKTYFEKLKYQRPKCINLNIAVSEIIGTVEFNLNTGHTVALSGIYKNYDLRHIARIKNENLTIGGKSKIIKVKSNTLSNILEKYNFSHVHFLSVDVEGSEFTVLKSINFDEVFIDVIGFENNFEDISKDIVDYLANFGYKVIHKSLDILMINKNSKFFKNLSFLKKIKINTGKGF
jgi:FkbM family methyltransferase